jgi:uncharacterized membrane protein YdbT with pleckstrin-like domain
MQYVKLTAAIAARVQAALFELVSFLGLLLVFVGATAAVAAVWLIGSVLKLWPSPKYWQQPATSHPRHVPPESHLR